MIDRDDPEMARWVRRNQQVDFGLFAPTLEPPRARATDPATSHAAAASMRDVAAQQAAAILTHLREHGPATADALDAAIGWRPTTAGRRLAELERAGQVRRLEETAPTRSGRAAHRWAAT